MFVVVGVTDLRRHRLKQHEARLKVGEIWHDLDLVFPKELGGLVDPANLLRSLAKLCDDAGVERITPYEVRNTAVSLLSDGGVPIEQLADLAGHKDARTTLAVYRHQLSTVVDAGSDIADAAISHQAGRAVR